MRSYTMDSGLPGTRLLTPTSHISINAYFNVQSDGRRCVAHHNFHSTLGHFLAASDAVPDG